jgi:hypothetical protein
MSGIPNMRRLSLLLSFIAAPAFAQPPGGDSSFAKIAAPFIDEHTLVVVRVDLARVDLGTVLKISRALDGNTEEMGNAADEVRAFVQEFGRRGGSDVFFTYGAGDFPHLPCLVIPAPKDPAAQKFLAQFFLDLYKLMGKDADWAALHGCVCVGPKDSLAVVKARKPVARPELAAAIEAGKDGVAQAAFALSAEAKKIHEQVAPTLPAELGGGAIEKVTRGMKWIALVVGPGPKMPAKWITEATSPEAAQDLRNIEARAQQAGLTQILKSDVESDAAFRQRVERIIDTQQTRVEGTRLTTDWELATTLLEVVRAPSGPPAERMRSANNLKQLMIALHLYHDVEGHFPVDSRTKDGKPLLSWRVHVLPYVDQEDLYKQFKLDEPWDSDHNKKLIEKMPKVFRSPRQAEALKDRTTYLAPLGPGFVWDDPKGLPISKITDGTSNTIALVEADDDRAVIWTKPEDITIDPKNPVAGLLGHYVEGFHAAMADGSVRFIKKSADAKTLWALFTRAGGESVGPPK